MLFFESNDHFASGYEIKRVFMGKSLLIRPAPNAVHCQIQLCINVSSVVEF